MFSKEMESLIEATLQDGILTDQEKVVLVKRAQKEGIDVDELDVYIQSLLQKRHQAEVERAAMENRQSKMGDMKKCPNCGNPVQLGWAACPACGFAFNVEETSSAYYNFSKKVSSMNASMSFIGALSGGWLRRIAEKANFIETYSVPNNRLVLLYFLTKLKSCSNIKGKATEKCNEDSKRFELSYWKLYERCILIAKRSFSNDPDFQEFFTHYDVQVQGANKKKGLFGLLFGK